MLHISLRPVVLADAPALNLNCWPERHIEAISAFINDVLNRTERQLTWGIVAIADGEVAGYGQLGRWGRVGEISDLIVTESLRDQGIGTAIIRHLVELARQMSLQRVEIGVQAANVDALRLYRRIGFVEKRRVTMQLGRGPEEIIILSIDLTALSRSA